MTMMRTMVFACGSTRIDLEMRTTEPVLDSRLHRTRHGGRRCVPLQRQVHRDPIDIDGYVLFGSQPLSWGAVLAYVLSPDK